jgi:hypothetical protein
MWVPKVPRRPDFCGCPPCPLCYDWADEGKEVMQGFLKFCLDMLGRTLEDALSRLPTPELRDQFRNQMRELADRVHQDKVDAAGVDPFKVDFEKQALEMQLNAAAAIREREKKFSRPARKSTVLLDNLELNPPIKQQKPVSVFIDEYSEFKSDQAEEFVQRATSDIISEYRRGLNEQMAVARVLKVAENISTKVSPATRERLISSMQESIKREFNNRMMLTMEKVMGGNPNFTYKRYQK